MCCGRSRRGTDRIEGFEILPRESLDAVLDHIPGYPAAARAATIPGTCWSRLTADSAEDEAPEELLARLLAPLIDRGLVADAAISASEAQAEAFWRIRDSLSEAERAAFGPATQHDISVPVDAMPRFLAEAAAEVETGVSRNPCVGLRPSRRRQHPFPCSRRGAAAARTGCSAKGRR